tara:strand:- start:7980 stop:8327 length:348 start_codon:yes stop_codon:yes gene_type:complete
LNKNKKNIFFKRRKPSRRLITPVQNKSFFYKIIFIIVAILVLIFILDDHGLYSFYEVNDTKRKLNKEIDDLRNEKLDLKSKKNKLENDIDFIEDLAREKLRMAKPGEKVIKVIKD